MNLKQIRIQNFRNLTDVTIHLNDVNLFIGPNNSGKSNVLQAIRLGSMIVQKKLLNEVETKYASSVSERVYVEMLNSIGLNKDGDVCYLTFEFQPDSHSQSEYFLMCKIQNYYGSLNYEIFFAIANKEHSNVSLSGIADQFFKFDNKKIAFLDILAPYSVTAGLFYYEIKESTIFKNHREMNNFLGDDKSIPFAKALISEFVNFPIYEIAPKELKKPYGLTNDKFIEFDGSNIVSFFDYLNSSREDIKENVKKTLMVISKEFSGFRLEGLDYIPEEIRRKFPTDTIKKFGLIDSKSYENTIWAEHLSDGILYFLALLCVVNQPYPPPILLLEEPEKGIHPRRIREVMDLLFALADERKIQIILTTHSTFVVDEFTDSPERVTVFDNKDGVITTQNLKNDILKKINESLEKNNYPKDYLEHSLGDNWALGLLGGVPH